MVRVFANGPGDLGSIPGRVIPKTLKMVLDTTLLNTQHYKVRFKGKVEQSWEWSSALPYTLVLAIEKGAFGSPSTMVANFTFTYFSIATWVECLPMVQENSQVKSYQRLKKMVLDATLLNTQHYKVLIKGKIQQME